ncbi:MAG: SIMPL domain-containing protein [Flavicella sp.]
MKNKIIGLLFSVVTLTIFAQNNGNVIKVQGNAILNDIPELLVVNMSLKTKALEYADCSDKLVHHYNQLEKAFQKNKIDKTKLKSSGVNINESITWYQGKSKKEGYNGSMSVTLEVPFANMSLNNIMNVMKNLDFSVPYNLNFKLSKSQKEKLLEETIAMAINDAKSKATHLATALGVKLGKVKEVNFGYTNSNDNILVPEYSRMESVNMKSGKSLNLNPQKIQIKKSVGVIWKIQQ